MDDQCDRCFPDLCDCYLGLDQSCYEEDEDDIPTGERCEDCGERGTFHCMETGRWFCPEHQRSPGEWRS